jgi:predicted nucleic acid-binding protein
VPAFLDTNILVYAVEDGSSDKHRRAGELVEEHLVNGDGFISVQVLREFYSVCRRLKAPLSEVDAANMVREFTRFRVLSEDTRLVVLATDRVRDGFSFWDALIVESALRGGADRLLTEDMQDGRVVEGMRITNPFD